MTTGRIGQIVVLVLCVFAAGVVCGDDIISPQSVTLTHLRDQGTTDASTAFFWRGDPLILTNSICYNATTNGGALQGLSNIVVTVRIGGSDGSSIYTGNVQNAAAGLYSCRIAVIPTNANTVYLQTTLTDSESNAYTYGWKILNVRSKL